MEITPMAREGLAQLVIDIVNAAIVNAPASVIEQGGGRCGSAPAGAVGHLRPLLVSFCQSCRFCFGCALAFGFVLPKRRV
jgi:hypothetical protein